MKIVTLHFFTFASLRFIFNYFLLCFVFVVVVAHVFVAVVAHVLLFLRHVVSSNPFLYLYVFKCALVWKEKKNLEFSCVAIHLISTTYIIFCLFVFNNRFFDCGFVVVSSTAHICHIQKGKFAKIANKLRYVPVFRRNLFCLLACFCFNTYE